MTVIAEPLSTTARRTTVMLGLGGALPFIATAAALWLVSFVLGNVVYVMLYVIY